MQSSQSSSASQGSLAGGSNGSSTRGAIAPRSRGKKAAAPDPHQPTLQQIFARAATKPAAAAAAVATAGPQAPAVASSPMHSPVPCRPVTAQPSAPPPCTTTAEPGALSPRPLLRPRIAASPTAASPTAASPTAASPIAASPIAASLVESPGPWTVEREVISLRRPVGHTASPIYNAHRSPGVGRLAAAMEVVDLTSPSSPVGSGAPGGLVGGAKASPSIRLFASRPEPLACRTTDAAETSAPSTSTATTTSLTTTTASVINSNDPPNAASASAAAATQGGAGSWMYDDGTARGSTGQPVPLAPSAECASDHVREVETLAARLARIRMRSAGATAMATAAGAMQEPAAGAGSGSSGSGPQPERLQPQLVQPCQQGLVQAQHQPGQPQLQLHSALAPAATPMAAGSRPGRAVASAYGSGFGLGSGSGHGGGEGCREDAFTAAARSGPASREGCAGEVSTTAQASTVAPPPGGGTNPREREQLARSWAAQPLVAPSQVPSGGPFAAASRRGAAAMAAGAATGSEGMVTTGAETAAGVALGTGAGAGAAAAGSKPSGGRGRAGSRAKAAGRSGKAPGGALLWTELSLEEREAAGGRTWIRWEPLPPEAVEGGGGGGPPPLYHLFAVDIETVDFMRGRQAFPRPDQVRLIEVAAVDLGPYESDATGTDPWVSGGGGYGRGRVFSTLVNCGRSFKAHKTILHNGITWEESSAPGVPGTVEALQRLFGFIGQRCAATAAAAAAAAADGDGDDVVFPKVIPVLMAHNGSTFDFPVLRSECGRVGVEWPQNWWYFDTLLAAKVLWAKADWPVKPAEGAEPEEPAEEEGEEEGTEAAGNGGGKRSLSMDALKLWAGVVSSGQAHRAEVDAVDLAVIWLKLFERWGRPGVQHLARLCSARSTTRPAAGPMHRLGLVSLAARADGLVRHVEAAVGTVLRPPTSSSRSHPQLEAAAAAASSSAAAVPTCMVLSPTQLRELAEGNRIHLRKPRGGADGFWFFEVLGQLPAALPGTYGGDGGAGGGSGAGGAAAPQQQPWPQSSLVPIVVLLRGVKLRYMTKASYGYKSDHTPKWEMGLAAAATGKTGSGGEGATTAEEVSELVTLLDNLARHASLEARGDAGRSARMYSCGKADGSERSGRKVITAQLHAQLSRGPAPGQLRWEPLATLATYDKKQASYKSLSWPPLESYVPEQAPASFSGQTELERIKEDNLSRVMAHLPDVASSEVVDVALWPEFCWVNNTGCGIRLKAVHVVRRNQR